MTNISLTTNEDEEANTELTVFSLLGSTLLSSPMSYLGIFKHSN